LQTLNALQGTPFTLAVRLLEIFGQQLEVQPESAQVILDFMDKAAGQLGQLGVLFHPNRHSGNTR
jgi:hypothetical protein